MPGIARNPLGRRRELYRELAVRGTASVAQLCEVLGVSAATLRRDLDALEREGLVARSYGGAQLRGTRAAERTFAMREREDVEAKRAIGAATARLLKPGHTIFLNDGSTVMAVARELAARSADLFVATPAVNVASVLAENQSITVCLLGGFVRSTSLATSGPFTESMTEQINADAALLSPDAFGLEEGMGFMHPGDAALARRMIRKAKQTVALVTSRKLLETARIMAASIEEVAILVTDRIQPELKHELTQRGLEIVEAVAQVAFEEEGV